MTVHDVGTSSSSDLRSTHRCWSYGTRKFARSVVALMLASGFPSNPIARSALEKLPDLGITRPAPTQTLSHKKCPDASIRATIRTMNPTEQTTVSPPRSQFVTLLAWFSIAVSCLMIFTSLMQNLMVHVLIPPDAFETLAQQGNSAPLPPFALFMFKHFKLIVFLFFLLSAVLLVSSIGLLKRKNWARIAFIVMLGVGIAWTVAMLPMQASIMNDVTQSLGGEAPADVENFVTIFRGVTLAFAVVFTAIHGWLIYKLCTAQIRAEFS